MGGKVGRKRKPSTELELLTHHVVVNANAAGVPWDTFHADFLIGCVMGWLHEHDRALTENGVMKIRRQ